MPTPELFLDDLRAGMGTSLVAGDFRPAIIPAERRRPWWLFPAIGAGAGTLAVGYRTYDVCVRGKEDCIFDPVTPVAVGAVAGMAAGGLVEWVVRVIEDS